MSQTQKFLVNVDLNGNQLKNVVLGATAGTANGAIWFDAFTGMVKFVDGSGTVQSAAAKSFVESAVADEADARALEITRIENLVSAEEAARILAVSGLAADLADEVSARQTAVSGVAADLADEVTARQNAVSNVASDLADEATARANADTTLQANIDAVAADLAALDADFATDAQVAAAVSAEQTRAEGVEAQLQSDLLDTNSNIEQLGYDLAAEVTNRQNAVTGVQENIDDEVIAREAAVAAVANDLADEVANRQTAVQGVSNTLADEISRVETSINEVADFLDAEILNRQNAVSGVASDLSDEAARAQSSELAISNRVTDLEDAAPSYALSATVSADIASEATRADAYADAAAATAEANAIAHADQIAQGLSAKEGVRTVVAIGALFPTQELEGTYTAYATTGDETGVELQIGDHVIVSDPDGSISGGIYTVASGAWTQRDDWANDTTKAGAFVYVAEGLFAGTAWVSLDIANNPSSPVWFFQQMSGVANVFSSDESITVLGNDIAVNTSVVAPILVESFMFSRKASHVIGNSSATSFTLSHELGEDVVVSVKEIATGNLVQAAVSCSSGSITVEFMAAPATDSIKVVIIG
jgi:hypothetical protein